MTSGAAFQWLDILRSEYLNDFIRRGGSAVKFLIPSAETNSDQVLQQLRVASEEEGFQFTSANAAHTKIHMIDRLFNELARQIEWDALALKFLQRVVAENGCKLSKDTASFRLDEIAILNEREKRFLLNDISKWLEREIYRDYGMSQEFRIAMRNLCLAQLDSENGSPSVLGALVKEWLRGELARISLLRDALIFQKITRNNARHVLFSLVHWLRRNEYSGMVLMLDISRYLISKRPRVPDDTFYYSVSAAVDVYELLRQFIDGTDEVDGLLIVVIAPVEFLNDDRRGLKRYNALRLRISDEVHDRLMQNPLGSVNRIS